MVITSDSGYLINLNRVEDYNAEVIENGQREIERRLTLWVNGEIEELKIKCPIVYQGLVMFLEKELSRKSRLINCK